LFTHNGNPSAGYAGRVTDTLRNVFNHPAGHGSIRDWVDQNETPCCGDLTIRIEK
jgi:hypothetical protein